MPGKITKTCPKCGELLVIRANHTTGVPFAGCSAYPNCSYTESLAEDVKMRAMGQPEQFPELAHESEPAGNTP